MYLHQTLISLSSKLLIPGNVFFPFFVCICAAFVLLLAVEDAELNIAALHDCVMDILYICFTSTFYDINPIMGGALLPI